MDLTIAVQRVGGRLARWRCGAARPGACVSCSHRCGVRCSQGEGREIRGSHEREPEAAGAGNLWAIGWR
jgi:hypothetical protein